MQYWLTKSEPGTYAWADLVRDKSTVWDGVRNFAARNHLRAMRRGDLVLFYHSGEGKEVVGVAKVKREAFPDPSAREGDWSAVELAPVKVLKKPVTLAQIKADKRLAKMALIRRPRLSVMGVEASEFSRVLELGETGV